MSLIFLQKWHRAALRSATASRCAARFVFQEKKQNAEHWTAPPEEVATIRRRVVYEGDPKPGALIGRLSFGRFSPSTERLGEDAEEALRVLRAAASGPSSVAGSAEGVGVSDAAMAAHFRSKHEKTTRDSNHGGAAADGVEGDANPESRGFRKPPALAGGSETKKRKKNPT